MLTIKWLGQSGYILSDGESEICIDPYLSDCVNRIANRPRTRAVPVLPEDLTSDAVICTHDHLDHIDIDAIPRMNKKKMLFLAPSACKDKLASLGVENYRPFDEGTEVKIGEFTLSAVFSHHTVPAVGVAVEHGGEKLYFSGDTYYNEKLESIKCDYMFICINGRLGNMNVDEASKLARKISPKVAIPNHYDMFESNSEDPTKFEYKNRFIMEFNKEYTVNSGKLALK